MHDYTDSLLISSCNLFDDKYHELKLKLGITDELDIQGVKGSLFKKYKEMVDSPKAATTLVTAENIHEVKVALTGKFITVDNGYSRWTESVFMILPPYNLSPELNRNNADSFFSKILAQRKIKNGKPELTYWVISEIE